MIQPFIFGNEYIKLNQYRTKLELSLITKWYHSSESIVPFNDVNVREVVRSAAISPCGNYKLDSNPSSLFFLEYSATSPILYRINLQEYLMFIIVSFIVLL